MSPFLKAYKRCFSLKQPMSSLCTDSADISLGCPDSSTWWPLRHSWHSWPSSDPIRLWAKSGRKADFWQRPHAQRHLQASQKLWWLLENQRKFPIRSWSCLLQLYGRSFYSQLEKCFADTKQLMTWKSAKICKNGRRKRKRIRSKMKLNVNEWLYYSHTHCHVCDKAKCFKAFRWERESKSH